MSAVCVSLSIPFPLYSDVRGYLLSAFFLIILAVSDIQTAEDSRVLRYRPSKEAGGELGFVVFTKFRGVSTPPGAGFKLPMRCSSTGKWKEMQSIEFWGARAPLDIKQAGHR